MRKALLTLLMLSSLFSLTSCVPPSDDPRVSVRIAGLKGPTGISFAYLMELDRTGKTKNSYEISLLSTPDEISARLLKNQLDIAAVPTNLAANLYNKTDGRIKLLSINTLGVLYVTDNTASINTIDDLSGKTINLSGIGSMPQYVMEYLIKSAKLINTQLEYKIEHAELASLVAANKADIALLPEPFVTAAIRKNPKTRVAIDIQKQWEEMTGVPLTMGVIVVRDEFFKQNKRAFNVFLSDLSQSVVIIEKDGEYIAALCDQYDIMDQEIVNVALDRCNIVNITGGDAKDALDRFYGILFEINPASIGGKIPGEDFYIK